MNNELIKQIFSLIKLNNKLIAVESPLQERLKLLTNLASQCQQHNINCYLWTLEDDALHQLETNKEGLTLHPINQYQAIAKTDAKITLKFSNSGKLPIYKAFSYLRVYFPGWENLPLTLIFLNCRVDQVSPN